MLEVLKSFFKTKHRLSLFSVFLCNRRGIKFFFCDLNLISIIICKRLYLPETWSCDEYLAFHIYVTRSEVVQVGWVIGVFIGGVGEKYVIGSSIRIALVMVSMQTYVIIKLVGAGAGL